MQKLFYCILFFSFLILASCHKKTVPNRSDSITVTQAHPGGEPARVDSQAVAPKPVVRRKPPVAVAKVITVNDGAAKKSVDGRLYYDVAGKRYWKNYKDGKYYLYDKSQYNNPDFKPR